LNLRPLGYEPYDDRLCRLGRYLVPALTSADLRCEVLPGPLHLCHLRLSHRVRFTNRFTEPDLDLWLSELSGVRTCVLQPISSPCHRPGPPVVERTRVSDFKNVGGSRHTSSATCTVGPKGGLAKQDHPACIPGRHHIRPDQSDRCSGSRARSTAAARSARTASRSVASWSRVANAVIISSAS
jgi:hypothetical protein